MFLRIKKIDGKEYAYIVQNKWKKNPTGNGKKGARQKVKGYLGRVFSFSRLNNAGFFESLSITDIEKYIKEKSKGQMISDLVFWEMKRHGVSKESIEFEKSSIKRDNKPCCIKINEGMLCGYTLSNLFNFKLESDEREEGFRLAKAFVDAGIEVPKELFIGMYEKIVGHGYQ